jgi:hypothetical protein
MRGGDPNFRKKIIMGIYLFMGIVISYIVGNADTVTLRRGFEMLYSGQCNSVSELALDYFGIGNPICTTHHKMIVLVGCALQGQVEAIMQIVGMVATTIASPLMIHAAINRLAGMIEGRVFALLGQSQFTIEDVNRPIGEIQNVETSLMTQQERPEVVAANVAKQIIEQVKSTPGLSKAIRDIINSNLRPEVRLDEEAIEEVHASSQPNTQEENYGGGIKKSKTKKQKKSRKHKSYKKNTNKNRKQTRKQTRKQIIKNWRK